MTDNVAIMAGYDVEYMAYADACDLHILVKPETDFDSRFKAWCCDEQEWIWVSGWNFTFEQIDEPHDAHMKEWRYISSVRSSLAKRGIEA